MLSSATCGQVAAEARTCIQGGQWAMGGSKHGCLPEAKSMGFGGRGRLQPGIRLQPGAVMEGAR